MKVLISALVLFLSLTVQGNSLVFDCSVEDFFVSDKTAPKKFIEGNLSKRFVIAVEDESIIVTSISDVYSSSLTRYKILSWDFKTIKAINSDSDFSSHIIVLDERNEDATISFQGSDYINVWFLDCQKQ